jgi:flagellar motor protein MotB
MASCTSRLTATAPAGTAALLTPLAMAMMSGVTPKNSEAVAAPRRP